VFPARFSNNVYCVIQGVPMDGSLAVTGGEYRHCVSEDTSTQRTFSVLLMCVVCVCLCVCACVTVCVCMSMYLCVYVCVCMYVCDNVCVRVWCVCVCVSEKVNFPCRSKRPINLICGL
jgi:hypothetical protein